MRSTLSSGRILPLAICAAAYAIAPACKSSTASSNTSAASAAAEDAGSSIVRDVGQGAGTAAGNVASGVESAGRGIADAGAAAYGTARGAASEAAQGASAAYGSVMDGGSASSAADGGMAATSSSDVSDGGMATAGGSTSTNAAPIGDGQILAIAGAANKGEIDEAKLAKKKSKNAKVKSFASMMVKDHTAADQQAKALAKKKSISPEENETSRQLTQDAQSTLSQLQGMTGKEFDTAYIQAQVKAHQQVLDSLDSSLIPNAKELQLKSLLQKVRTKVAAHLKQAQTLSDTLSR